MIHITETIKQYLGWCPNVQPQVRKITNEPDEIMTSSSQRGSLKDHALHWFDLFRNQVLLFAITISATGFWLFAGLGEWSYPLLFICGIIAGLPVSAYVGIWHVRIFDEVLHDGPVVLRNQYDTSTNSPLTRICAFAPVVIVTVVLTGAIPGANLAMTNAIIAGIVTILIWGQVLSIWKWESDHHKKLQYDGIILEFEKGEKHVSF